MTVLSIDIRTIGSNPRASRTVIGGTTVFCVLLSLLTLFFWLRYNPAVTLSAEVPGHDGLPPGGASQMAKVNLAGVFQTFDGKPSAVAGEWRSFRGPNASNIAEEVPPLASAWGGEGPEVLWKIPVGDGYAAPAVLNGCVYLMDYDVEQRSDMIRCLSLDDGREIWRRSYAINIKRNHGMSRTIPAVTEDYLVVIGPKCHVLCMDSATGDFRWGLDLQKDYGTAEPLWYAGQCPLIDKDTAIIAACGTDVLMMGVDCKSGDVLWTTPNPWEWDMSHSSVIPMTILGKKMYVYSALGGMVGVSAEPGNVGEVLWEAPWVAKVVAPSPVKAGDDLIFATAGYGKGSRLLKFREENGKMAFDVIYDKTPTEILSCEQQTPIFSDGLLYGIMPKGSGSLQGQFVCYRPDGEMLWSSGQDHRFGLGPFLLADGKFFILDDDGTLTMAEVRRQEFVPLGQADVLEGHDAWGPFALAGSRLLLRDMNTLACVELGAAS